MPQVVFFRDGIRSALNLSWCGGGSGRRVSAIHVVKTVSHAAMFRRNASVSQHPAVTDHIPFSTPVVMMIKMVSVTRRTHTLLQNTALCGAAFTADNYSGSSILRKMWRDLPRNRSGKNVERKASRRLTNSLNFVDCQITSRHSEPSYPKAQEVKKKRLIRKPGSAM
ncbi:hypothetical protein IscW_ISCW017787 [Ixodes scapularis]|uniref:Uncharacterized protein n=1 Tax=Ixodes scapularis TaxID=6945 RepID=B7PIH9_IXOSC|nr:hypothetical protein IscW_ISCW017787 [Ixodes scapularis]|eukprot:XP_002405232.1 hypothetical protein IscW_ISCW017787 [Ixodes scapularis]